MRFEGEHLVSVLTINENFIHTKYGYCYYSNGIAPLIWNLYIYPQYRRKGHAKRLLRMMIDEILFEMDTPRPINIEVSPRENSINVEDLTRFYKSMGLHILKEVEK